MHRLAGGAGGRLYLQAHRGTYVSDDAADHWTEITEGLSSDYALAIAAHPHDRDTAYVIPLVGGYQVSGANRVATLNIGGSGTTSVSFIVGK